MNFIINKIIYVFNHPWLIVFSLVVVLGLQVSNLKQEVQNLKSQMNQTVSHEVRLPSTTIVPLPSNNQISIPQSQE